MTVTVHEQLLANLCQGGGVFVLRGASDEERAATAMRAAARAVASIPHPDEPDDPLPNFVSAITRSAEGPSFSIDVKDMLDDNAPLARQVVTAVVVALDVAGTDGELGFIDTLDVPFPEPEAIDASTVFITRFGRGSLESVVRALAGSDFDTVSPVLGPLAFALGDRTVDDARRQALRPLARRLLNTANVAADRERQGRVVDWWVRDEVPHALAFAGVSNTLGELPALHPDAQLRPTFGALADVVMVMRAQLIDQAGGSEKHGNPVVWGQGDRPAAIHLTSAVQLAVGESARHADHIFMNTFARHTKFVQSEIVRAMWTATWINAAELLRRRTGDAVGRDLLGYSDHAFHVSRSVYNSLQHELPAVMCTAAEVALTDLAAGCAALVDVVAAGDRWVEAEQLYAQKPAPASFGGFKDAVLDRLRENLTPRTYGEVTRSALTAFGAYCYQGAELLVGGDELASSFAPDSWQRVHVLIDSLL